MKLTCSLTVSFLMLIRFYSLPAQAKYDTLVMNEDSVEVRAQAYPLKDRVLLFEKPRHFAFVTQVPRTFGWSAQEIVRKKSLPALGAIAGSTLLLILTDQKITDGVQQFSRYIGVDPERKYKTLVGFNLGSLKVNAYEAPGNLNSALYSMGEGCTSMFLCGGLFVYGKIKNDYRALQTSSQIVQASLAVGITCQLLKRVTGRESPFVATASNGVWRPFTSLADYQKHVPRHDAFPSGHLATMMATLVVLADNYPEKRWIKPVGYSLMALTGLAMINNGVHWAGDYPLALGIGYIFGKMSVKMNRMVRPRK